ncbi:glyoxalase [Brachybacterium avium]|uniref:Glyoxalase n=1 Tax=Brachybacterium avium TaxID=2017485 RepID=A0A220UDH5_9MICO|nr:VOC family protein [Brachybacterium avium]ASK65976.1 glyoxalase [Brachybacterium avium]
MDTTGSPHTTNSPEPHVGVFPAFQALDARGEIRFLCEVLGFVETLVVPGEGEAIAHAQLDWPGGGAVMLGTHKPDGEYRREPGTLGAYLVIDDAELDALVERAKGAGARIVQPLRAPEHGGRDVTIASPEGNLWSIGTYPGEPAATTP